MLVVRSMMARTIFSLMVAMAITHGPVSAQTAPASPASAPAPHPADAYAPLQLYAGTWQVSPDGRAGAPDVLIDTCGRTGIFFSCEQNVNGKTGALIVFIPTSEAGHYRTQALLPNGKALGSSDLVIEGNHWMYTSQEEGDAGKTTYRRISNEFTGSDQIRFQVEHSTDNKTWVTDLSGSEKRSSK